MRRFSAHMPPNLRLAVVEILQELDGLAGTARGSPSSPCSKLPMRSRRSGWVIPETLGRLAPNPSRSSSM